MAHGQTQTWLRIPEARLTTGSNGPEKRASALWWPCLSVSSLHLQRWIIFPCVFSWLGLFTPPIEGKLTWHDLVAALGL